MKKNILLAMMMSITGMLSGAPAFANGNGWAVIVYNTQSGAWGSSHGGFTRQTAEQDALNFCGAGCVGTDVSILEMNSQNRSGVVRETWVQNGWIALAVGSNGHWATSGIHDSQADAESAAYSSCGGPVNNCYIVRSLSSYQNGSDIDGVRPQ